MLIYTKGAHVANLKGYLHNKITLSPAFDPGIDSMLEAKILAQRYDSPKNKEGVNDIAYWIDEGYGYFTRPGKDKEDLDITHIDEIFPSKMIALDANGFFNGIASGRDLHFTRGSVIVPFSRSNFDILKITAPEAADLAACILAELKRHAVEVANRNILSIKVQLAVFLETYGEGVWQHFSQKQLADYFGISEVYISRLRGGG